METNSLYIHIPFCVSKCTYCDFFSIPISKGQTSCFKNYVNALKNEIDFRIKYFDIKFLSTIYIGGGTPSLFSPSGIKDILNFIKTKCKVDINAEITMEANPQDISEDFLLELKCSGVNRLSVGIQCYNDSVLKLLKRRCNLHQVDKALDLIKKHWVSEGFSFSCDLISGLPSLCDDDFLLGIKKIISYGVNHISLYSLMLEEDTTLYQQISSNEILYSEENNENQWILGKEFLEKNGFYQYEVSNFAKPGSESRHNTVYWHIENYLGCGAGATGTVDYYRWNNLTDLEKYVDFWKNVNFNDFTKNSEQVFNSSIPQEEEFLSVKDKEFEFLMMGFRLKEGVKASAYNSLFGKDLSTRLGYDESLKDDFKIFNKWILEGKAKVEKLQNEDLIFSLTDSGLMFLNQFLEEIL